MRNNKNKPEQIKQKDSSISFTNSERFISNKC